MSERWQPIKTAPFGTDVIVFFPELSEEYRVMICHRFEEAPSEWYQQDADQCPSAVEDEPTHWMPMPSEPTREDA